MNPQEMAFEITSAAITALAKPAMTLALRGLNSLSQSVIDSFSSRLSDYLESQTRRHSCMSTIVFGHQKSIEELYIPLTVISDASRGKEVAIKIDRFQNDFLPKNNRVLITDTAGMGKSTLSKFLFLQCMKSGYAIPFFLELRNLTAKKDIYVTLLDQLNPRSRTDDEPRFTKRHLQKLLKSTSLLFFFDGYDEISPQELALPPYTRTRSSRNIALIPLAGPYAPARLAAA